MNDRHLRPLPSGPAPGDFLEGDHGDWQPPLRFLCNRGGLNDPDECDCGYVGKWWWRTWRIVGKPLRTGVDEQCPQCGDLERYEWTADRGIVLVAEVRASQPPLF